jgi:hypothetical protein
MVTNVVSFYDGLKNKQLAYSLMYLDKMLLPDLPKALWLIQPKLLAQTNIWELVQTNLNHNPSAEKKFSICLYAALCPHPGGTF